MLQTSLYTFGAVLAVSLLSLIGVVLFFVKEKWIQASLLSFVSISTGALLGDVFIHILPELAETAETFPRDLLIVLGGILFSFAMEKFIYWRHCHVLPSDTHHHPMGLINLFGESMHNFID